MKFKYFKTIEKDSLADGGSWSDDWDVDIGLIIKRIYLVNKTGAAFTDSEFYLKIVEDVFTHSVVPAVTLGQDKEVSPELDIPVAAKSKISWTFENNEGVAVNLYLVFECWVEK